MSIKCFAKCFALGCAFAAVLFVRPIAARAEFETCGAHLRPPVALPQQPDAKATTYAYVLRADTGRSAQGQVVADTDHGWFAWTFPMTLLTRKDATVRIGRVAMDGKDYQSDPLYVAFPLGTLVRRAWVEQATTSGETVFGWDTRGTVICPVPDFGDGDPRGVPDVPPAVPSGTSIATVSTTQARFIPDCAQPFVRAAVLSVPRIIGSSDFSGPTRGTGVYAVAIDDTGAVLDAWTFGSSGNPHWDIMASTGLKRAKLRAPVSYCTPVAATLYLIESFRQ